MSSQRSREAVLAGFIKDTAKHQVTVKLDQGVYRHLRCQAPGTWIYGFDIVTYPGFLVFSGDMGSFVFERLPDMFEFFRDGKMRGEAISINPSYWAEKVQAGDRSPRGDGVKSFSADTFCQRVTERVRESDLSEEDQAEVLAALEDGVFSEARDYGEDEGIAAAALHRFSDERVDFTDFFEIDCREYSYRFLWCCYALRWAIREYDAIKATKVAA